MHSSPVVTSEGLPLGLAAIKFWTRKHFKGCNALKRKINPTRVPINKKESLRWLENVKEATAHLGWAAQCLHVGDRQSDIFESEVRGSVGAPADRQGETISRATTYGDPCRRAVNAEGTRKDPVKVTHQPPNRLA